MPCSLPARIVEPFPVTSQLQLLINAARAAAEDETHPDAVELEILADILADQTVMVFPRGPADRPFLVIGGDDERLLQWGQTAAEAALADLGELVDDPDVEYEGFEIRERAEQRGHDMEDLFRATDWDSCTIRVYDVLTADLAPREMPLFGNELTHGRLPLVGTFTAFSYSGDEEGPWESAREATAEVGGPRP